MENFHPRDIKRIAELVTELTGNRIQDKNYSMLESRMSSHLLQLGLSSMAEYWAYFESNEAQERETLQSLMTTHHTFFFREYAHFEALESWITAQLPRLEARFKLDRTPVRVWSAACSRGQEAYSLAMFLDKVLFRRHGIEYEILGTDIDRSSVGYAQNGVYPIQEVSAIPAEYLNSCWKRGTGAIADFAAIHPRLRAKTRFESANLLALDGRPETPAFDVIFCRNVFIYFSEADVRKAALDLAKRLAPNGLFVSGLSEPLRFPGWTLQNAGPSAYIKTAEAPRLSPAPTPLPAPVTAAAAPLSVPTRPAERYRVLCVDDSPTIQTLMRKIFGSDAACAEVQVATNGREAREKLDRGKFDLITLDIHMPEVNGIEFLERLYNKKSDPPVLVISSVNRTDIALATKTLSLGAFDYVEKPALNQLQKSTSEILLKAKMALRSETAPGRGPSVGSFDSSIGQSIVVPDASQCLRVVFANGRNIAKVAHIVRGQEIEQRSPPLLIVLPNGEVPTAEEMALHWTPRTISGIREGQTPVLRPNGVYFLRSDGTDLPVAWLKDKSVSLQILTEQTVDSRSLRECRKLQILMEEELGGGRSRIPGGFELSDLAPSTSFPSLSLEFFANLRKAA